MNGDHGQKRDRGRWTRLALGLLAFLFAIPGAAAASSKKLIEFGWDEPDTDDLPGHVWEMEQRPFDGVVISTHYRDAQNTRHVLEWSAFSNAPIDWQWLQPGLQNLKKAGFHRFTDNFLRFNTAPGDVDWFDDFSPIVHNAAMVARFCRQGHLKGVLFDAEAYNVQLFEYPRQKYHDRHSFEEYAAQVRRRGMEIMNAFQAEYPDLTVFMTIGYEVTGSNPQELRTGRYGLLAPFLDGLYSAARGKTRIVDGYEPSYPFQSAAPFEKAYRQMRQDALAVCGAPEAYHRHLSCGFGVWIDYNWRELGGWRTTGDFAGNYHSPAELKTVLATALRRSDRYVWLYSEKPNWWTLKDVPPAYLDAVRRGREEGR